MQTYDRRAPARLPARARSRASRSWCWAALASLGLALGPARATAESLDLSHALSRALGESPELAAFEHRHVEQAGRLRQAELLPNPELTVDFEDFAGSGELQGVDSAETTLGLGWVLDGRVRRRRVDAERARAALVDVEARALRLDVAAETAQRFLSCLGIQAREAAAVEAVALAEETVAAVKRRVAAGRAPDAARMRAEAELEAARMLREEASHDRRASRHRLAAQWGAPEPDFSRVAGDLSALPSLEPFDAFADRIERNPAVARLVSEARLAREEVRVAEAARWPALRPGFGVRHTAASGDVALVAKLRVPFPLFDRNQGRIASSRAALARTRAEAEAERVRVRTRLYELYEELRHHVHRAEALGERIIPRLEEARDEMRRGYERGRFGYFEWQAVETELFGAKSALIEARTGAHRLAISLERLTGEALTTP